MSKHRTTVFLESDMLNAIRKVAKEDERPMAYHYDKALRAYGPINKLLTKEVVAVKAKPVAKAFSKPRAQELGNYFFERGSIDAINQADKFFDFYESKDWKVGKNKMKDWKAAVRNWMRGNDEAAKRSTQSSTKQRIGDAIHGATANDW